jgi:hypothetical protein
VTSAEPSTSATATATGPGPTAAASTAFSRSMVVSGTRCLLAYVVFPWLLPLLGVVPGVGAAVGLCLSGVGIGFNIASIRRFSRTEVRWRSVVIAMNLTVIALLVVLIALDVAALT